MQRSGTAALYQSNCVGSFLRALIVCGACISLAEVQGAKPAAFPFVITALTWHVANRWEVMRVGVQLLSHVLSACGAALILSLQIGEAVLLEWVQIAVLPVGCLLLVLLQFTRFRHPPALASGGAVLYGIQPGAVVRCAVITVVVLLVDFVMWRAKRSLSMKP